MRPDLPLCLRQSIPIGSLTVGSWEEYVDRGRASEALAGYRLPVCSFRAFPPFHSPILQSFLERFTTSNSSTAKAIADRCYHREEGSAS